MAATAASSSTNYSHRMPSLDAQGSMAPPATSARQRANPLTDLIATEQVYVQNLGSIIRKVASAWSKNNYPPKPLDRLFRAIEACYRINKALLAQLTDIGPNPTSPKALGDLLMRWVDDILPSYSTYASVYRSGFDGFPPIMSNTKLPGLLAQLPQDLQSLDALLLLPYQRLQYYKKLYGKLLQSTTQGRSDHRNLLAANEKLNELIARCESALNLSVEQEETTPLPQPAAAASSASDTRHLPPLPPIQTISLQDAAPSANREEPSMRSNRAPSPWVTGPSARNSSTSAASSNNSRQLDSRTSSWSQSGRDEASHAPTTNATTSSSSLLDRRQHSSYSSQATTAPSEKRTSMEWLENRLDTTRTLDLFVLQPKKCRLQINPPGMAYTRTTRFNGDVSMVFQPSPASIQAQQNIARDTSATLKTSLVIPQAHIFLLTDLFLLCERMPTQSSGSKANMWLVFPPLAGKHLSVKPVNDADGCSFDMIIMKREVLQMTCQSKQERDAWISHFTDCIDFSVGQKSASLPCASTSKAYNLATTAELPPLSLNVDGGNLDRNASTTSNSTISPAYPQNGQTYSPSPISPPPGQSPSSATSNLKSPPPDLSGPPRAPYMSQPQPRSWTGSVGSTASLSSAMTAHSEFGAYRSRSASPLPGSYQSFTAPLSSGGPAGPRRLPERRSSNALPPGALPRSFSPPPSLQSAPLPGAAPNGRLPPLTLRKNGSRSTGSLREQGHSFDPHRAPPMPANASHVSLDHFNNSRHGSFSTGSSFRAPSSLSPSRSNTIHEDQSPPISPVDAQPREVKNQLMAQSKCKVFLQSSHQQWKSLGTAKLMLYLQIPGHGKQLVCQQENKDKTVIISTMVLTDGVERVGKTGVAIELSDQGSRTGIVYMLQLKTEQSATTLYGQLLQGSDRDRHSVAT